MEPAGILAWAVLPRFDFEQLAVAVVVVVVLVVLLLMLLLLLAVYR